MNPLDYDFFNYEPSKVPSEIAMDLIRGLEDRCYNYMKKSRSKTKESREIYAEDEVVRKKCYDEMRCEVPGQPRSTFLMVFSPDGSKVASTHGNHNIYITDIKTGKNVRTLVGHPRTPWCIAFHPTSNQIVASGCLGGEVRIWDLSGGSEVWTAGTQSVIASIAFHPNDRILVIATYNELYFWDWSQPEPFVQVATSNPKEKIRYVAFDKLGHKLITGIANGPQTRWERVRAPVPVPVRQPDRLRITPRLLSTTARSSSLSTILGNVPGREEYGSQESTSSVPERERRITASYRNLLREYEQLVQRYLKVYRPPTMVDRGTDPMEANANNSSQPSASGSRLQESPNSNSPPDDNPQPSTSQNYISSLMMVPSRILAIKTQTTDSRKHKSSDCSDGSSKGKRTKCDDSVPSTSSHTETATQTQSPRKLLHISDKTQSEPSTSGTQNSPRSPGVRIMCPKSNKRKPGSPNEVLTRPSGVDINEPSTSRGTRGDSSLNIRPIAEEVRNRFLPIIKSLPACDRPKLIRRFEKSRAHERLKLRQMGPTAPKKPNRRQLLMLDTSSDSSSSDDEQSSSGVNVDSSATEPTQPSASGTQAAPNSPIGGVRNLMELEQLLMSVLMTEISEGGDSQSPSTSRRQLNIDPDSSLPNANQDATRPEVDIAGQPESQDFTFSDRFSRSAYLRRRLISPRTSAFSPTRVYNRANQGPLQSRFRRGGVRINHHPVDELINYAERPNAEDDIPDSSPSPPGATSSTGAPDDAGISSMYSNIVQGLESSLNDVRNLRTTTRPGETTSDMLSSFTESLENIMTQSDTILRNLGGSMSLLPNYSEQGEGNASRESNEPRVSFNDQEFYVRDRNSGDRSVVESEHNYPRNPEGIQSSSSGENMSPLMTSLHLTISYIQRQARLLRQQVESIERIDRAMFEVEQLQLIRQLLMESLRYIRFVGGEGRGTGLSSVRQMMAGTRISDSGDSHSEDANRSNSPSNAPSTSRTNEQPPTRPKSSGRKTYPPSRLLRVQRQNRRSVFINFFPRRYPARADRGGIKHPGPSRNLPRTTSEQVTNPLRNLSNYSLITSTGLNLMARRLEILLTDQTRSLTRPQETSPGPSRPSTAPGELAERLLSHRLHGCVLRMTRILGDDSEGNRFRNCRSDSVVVSQDGASRYGARNFLSLIVDSMCKHMEEMNGSNIAQSLRVQIHSVFAMALLLCDLLLLQLVDSIPPPAGMNLDVERESLTSRINQMCGQMLQSRFSGHSQQLTRSLHYMRLTMRQAYSALGHTYNARRSAMLPNRQDNRRQLLRYLRNINRRRPSQTAEQSSSNDADRDQNAGPSDAWRDNLRRRLGYGTLFRRYSDNVADEEETNSQRSSAANRNDDTSPRTDNVSSNNSDENEDSPLVWVNSTSNRNTNLYRSSIVNLVSSGEAPVSSPNPSRLWNVPTVQVNDVPISEAPSYFQRRMLSRHQRIAERVSELRSFPQMNVLRPRFLHPLYGSVNPFDADLDDPQRDTTYDCDMITTITPNHRIQMWDISSGNIPTINNPQKNVIVSECKIHNDASVDIAKDGTILVTLLPSGGYLNVTNKLGVYSLRWDTLGQCLYTTSFEQNAVSVALSPLSRHLVVGLASRRVSLVPSDRWTMARIFIIDQKNVPVGNPLPTLRELGQNRDSRATSYKSINCIRWLPTSGQGLIYATNTGELVILT